MAAGVQPGQAARRGVKRYSQAKLNMVREALSKLDRQANEHGATYFKVLAG